MAQIMFLYKISAWIGNLTSENPSVFYLNYLLVRVWDCGEVPHDAYAIVPVDQQWPGSWVTFQGRSHPFMSMSLNVKMASGLHERRLLTHWCLGGVLVILKISSRNTFYGKNFMSNSCQFFLKLFVACRLCVFYVRKIMISVCRLMRECHRWWHLMISQHWFWWWLGAIRQQTSHNLSQCWPRLCHYMASLGYNNLTPWYMYLKIGNIKTTIIFLTVVLRWTTDDPDTWSHMASLGHSELTG